MLSSTPGILLPDVLLEVPTRGGAEDGYDAFVPNGLLNSTPRDLSPSLQASPSTEVSHSRQSSHSGSKTGDLYLGLELVPNGLLGEPSSKQDVPPSSPSPEPFRPNGLLSQSQDEELPDIADLLRPYARTTAHASGSSAGISTAPIVLPRSSLRAHTYAGQPVFLRRRARQKIGVVQPVRESQRMGNLLDVPIHRLLDHLSVNTARKLAKEDDDDPATASSATEDSLWVDRYRPKRFTELLGDERVHREVLGWVKEWDHCVFGKSKTKGKKRARDGEETNLLQEDALHRPQEKILLLSGPPGLGKTTLAHVIARQAGYAVFEINASDARTGQVVDDRIRPALESGFAVGSSKPVLIVIDEIDGATGDNASGFIHKLIQLTWEKTSKGRGKKRDDKGKRPLRRPIICICNDLYASSLAKLRPIARIVRFTRPTDVHIVKRLREICELEAVHADTRALSTLVGVTRGDLRGCLNTLQFIKARNQEVTEHVIRTATAGMKEADSNYLSVLNDFFSPMSKKRVKERGLGELDEQKYIDRLSRAADATGALDRIALGCFEHYANTHQHDATFARYVKANEWLVAYDVLSGSLRAEREYAILPYLSYSLVAFYPLFQERGGHRVERPKADWENHVKTQANQEVYKSLARAVRTGHGRTSGNYRHLIGDQIMRLELAPYINRIISPPIRPVNSQVIRPEEKAILSRLVNIMVSLELRFVQEKGEDGQLMYRLDPPIDVFVTYDGKRAADIVVSRYAVRHLVAFEIDAQLIARQADAVERTQTRKASSFFGASRREARGDDNGDGALEPADEPRRKRAKAGPAVDIADQPAVDFFGRPIVPTTTGGPSKLHSAPAQSEKPYRVSFRFSEGSSAAVRKHAKVSSFL
ncbi:P-loop containing nucleoside triphosphate hydrolase protein [Auriscalpium vulgare]|uniref:P-loop containing nucleoside triphosphate hydrolase protein n=1 Tax=Auriscalpium vulgare TaxID=40419 RepID=A0ACB8SD06_9AGAM|nr:P-loop containing nucleoside triphosphate hydrolase protein [Auriscalpium vulgare]